MLLRPVVRRVLLACSVLLLIALSWGTLSGGLRQLPRCRTAGQRVETAVQLLCGLLSLLTALTCFWWRRWGSSVRFAWAISLTIAVGLSPLVWGPPMPLIAMLFAVVALLVALAIIWAIHRALAV